MIYIVLLLLSCLTPVFSFMRRTCCAIEKSSVLRSLMVNHDLEAVPFDDIIPFLSEHIQPSDQILFLGN